MRRVHAGAVAVKAAAVVGSAPLFPRPTHLRFTKTRWLSSSVSTVSIELGEAVLAGLAPADQPPPIARPPSALPACRLRPHRPSGEHLEPWAGSGWRNAMRRASRGTSSSRRAPQRSCGTRLRRGAVCHPPIAKGLLTSHRWCFALQVCRAACERDDVTVVGEPRGPADRPAGGSGLGAAAAAAGAGSSRSAPLAEPQRGLSLAASQPGICSRS